MSAQLTYNFGPKAGVAGGIVDLAPYMVDAFLNEEDTGVLKFGMGVVAGEGANGLALPNGDSAGADFLGITVNGRTTEYDLEGNTYIRNKAAVGVMRYGRIYARVAEGVTVAFGEDAYLVISGDDKGCFTNTAGETSVAINGKFNTAADSNGIAQIDLYNAPAPAAASEG